MRRLGLIFGLVLIWGVTSLAEQLDEPLVDEDVVIEDEQEPVPEDEGNGFLLTFIQNLLSAPGREVQIRGISGILASVATIDEITVSDADGVWLRVRDISIDWSRRALFLRRVDVSELTIGSIDYIRPPLPSEPVGPRLEDAEARPFALPELPVQVLLGHLEVGALRFGEPVLGQAAELSVAGSLTLIAGELDTDLAVRRLDGPGGELTLQAAFSNVTRELDIDLVLSEPPGGVVATALNIEGRPAIELRLQGAGPLDDVDIDFSFDADAVRLAAGEVLLRDAPDGLAFLADFAGELAPLVPPDYRDFFAGRSAVRVEGVNKDAGGFRIDELAIAGPALDIAGDLETGTDGFLISLNLSGEIGDPRGPALTLPVPGGQTRVVAGVLEVSYGDASRWDGYFALDRLAVGDIAIEDLTLSMGGLAQNLQQPEIRNVTIHVEGLATGIWAADPDVRQALGDRIDFFADIALPPDAPIRLRQVQLTGDALSVFTAGTLEDLVYTGRHVVRLADISPLSGLADRALAGGIDVRAQGDVFLASAGFDLSLEGVAADLQLDEPQIDPLLAGETTISGRLRRDEFGLRTEDFRFANEQLVFTSTGIVGTETDIGFEASLADLALVADGVSGAATARGRAAGLAAGPLNVELAAAIPEGNILGREIVGAAVAFDGAVLDGDITGHIDGTGRMNGSDIALTGDIGLVSESRSLQDFRFEVGPNVVTGDIVQRGEEPIEGRLDLRAPDLTPLAALALLEAEGAANATIVLGAAEVGQGVSVTADARNLAYADYRVGALDLEAEIEDALGVPLATATLSAEDVAAVGIELARLDLTAEQTTETSMAFAAETLLAIGTEVALAGELERLADGFALSLERLTLEHEAIAASLLAPATVTLADDEIVLSPLALALGDGRLEVSGRIADEIDVALTIDSLPLALANAVQPELGLTGTVDGSARVTGPRDAPQIGFDLTAADVSAAVLQAAGLPPMAVEARGDTVGTLLTFDARTFSVAAGIEARAAGTYETDTGALDFDLDLGALPLDVIDDFIGQQGLEGTLSGTARVTGTPAAPDVAFNLAGSGVSLQATRDLFVPPLALTAQGRFADAVVTLAAASATAPGDIALSASGNLPLTGPGLSLAVSGGLPLSLANPLLADRAAQLAGRASFDVTVGGSLADPTFSGPLSVTAATFVDPLTNVRFDNIGVDAMLDGRTLVLGAFSGQGALGGTVAGSGQIVLDPAANFPAELQLALRSLGYTDGTFISTAILDGNLALSGALTGQILVQGTIDLDATEISVAEGLGVQGALALEAVSHRNPPAPVRRTLERARATELETARAGGRSEIVTDILIRAPNQIFVRGRGLDVELGGQLRVQGPTNDLQPVGQFTLRRGRLSILGQRIEFDEGSLRLIGDLDPEIMFVARTVTREATVIVTMSGRVSEPEIELSSVPELPEDEVLALVIFNRSAQQLSPFQIAQLAAAAAELAGATGNGLLARFRGAVGLDELDIIPDDNGGAAVRAGRYIDENIYLDVQTGTGGDTRVSINLDITENVTTRGTVDTDGNSSIGIFFTRDY